MAKSYSIDFLEVIQNIEDAIGFNCLSQYEKQFIEKNYKKLGMNKTAFHLNRPTQSVYLYAKKIGLTRKKRFYTENEINFLKENYSLLGVDECAKKLKRSSASIRFKASELGLKHSKWKTDEQKECIAEYYSKYGCKKTAEILGKSEGAIYSYASKNNILSPVKYWNEYEDCFLKENYKKMTNDQIAKKLGRTKESIKTRLIRLNLSRKSKEEQ